MSTSSPPVIDIATLTAPGKASISERDGKLTINSGNPLKALQVVATQGGIRIHLTQTEIDDLLAAGKLQIKVSFTLHDSPSATLAAQQIVSIAKAALQAKRGVPLGRIWSKIVLALILMVLVIITFLLAIRLLDMAYGTHQLEALLGWI